MYRETFSNARRSPSFKRYGAIFDDMKTKYLFIFIFLVMEPAVECTHCGVVMTSWSVPASPIRYSQCPFCQRTHSSHYGEVFRAQRRRPPAGQRAARHLAVRSASMARPKATAGRPSRRPPTAGTRGSRTSTGTRRRDLHGRRPGPLTVSERAHLRGPVDDVSVDVELERPSRCGRPSPTFRVGAGKRR